MLPARFLPTMTDAQLEEMHQWEDQEIEAAYLESRESDPVYRRFRFHAWVSSSKGKGRTRKRLTEVELINDLESSSPTHWVSHHKFPFDVKATEVYGRSEDGLALEAQLMRDIRECSR